MGKQDKDKKGKGSQAKPNNTRTPRVAKLPDAEIIKEEKEDKPAKTGKFPTGAALQKMHIDSLTATHKESKSKYKLVTDPKEMAEILAYKKK